MKILAFYCDFSAKWTNTRRVGFIGLKFSKTWPKKSAKKSAKKSKWERRAGTMQVGIWMVHEHCALRALCANCAQCALYTMHNTLCTLCTVHNAQYTVHNVHCGHCEHCALWGKKLGTNDRVLVNNQYARAIKLIFFSLLKPNHNLTFIWLTVHFVDAGARVSNQFKTHSKPSQVRPLKKIF